MLRVLLAISVLPLIPLAQTVPYPLETVSVTGTVFPKDMVMQMAGLRIGMPLDKANIDEACGKLQATGFFQSVNYRYGPAPKHGYALTLIVADDKAMAPAAIDVPGVDEEEVWRWLQAKYPPFDHKVPVNDAAEQVLIKDIEQHLGPKLDGQHVVTRMEADLNGAGKTTIVFEPDIMPRVAAMSFTGNHELTSAQLLASIEKVNAEQEYTERRFRGYVDLNLRRTYEDHGMYKVRFPSITSAKAGDRTVNVTVAIDEGPQYTLGDVHITGADLPEKEMLKAANFKTGKVANWTEIQNGIWAMEKPVKRTGHYDAAVIPERVFDDQRHVLNLNLTVKKGPLYSLGTMTITGLSPDQQAKARGLWHARTGDPFDFEYPNDFFLDFSRVVDLRQFKKYQAITSKKPGNVMDVTLQFEPR